jgi:predicted metal-dependent hydrolase
MGVFFKAPHRPHAPEVAELVVGGDVLPVTIRRHARARRMILRLDRQATRVIVTMPERASRRKAIEFARMNEGWIRSRLCAVPPAVPFAQGAIIPLRGVPHQIRHFDAKRGGVRVAGEAQDSIAVIEVAGDIAHLARRVRDWLKEESKRELAAASLAYATAMRVRFRKVSVRDPASRWGSCSAKGHLSYSWRLIFAPPFVLDYVAAHEVAHLAHMNHGPKFWALVAKHCPEFERARQWMKRYGRMLHSYGG